MNDLHPLFFHIMCIKRNDDNIWSAMFVKISYYDIVKTPYYGFVKTSRPFYNPLVSTRCYERIF